MEIYIDPKKVMESAQGKEIAEVMLEDVLNLVSLSDIDLSKANVPDVMRWLDACPSIRMLQAPDMICNLGEITDKLMEVVFDRDCIALIFSVNKFYFLDIHILAQKSGVKMILTRDLKKSNFPKEELTTKTTLGVFVLTNSSGQPVVPIFKI